MAFMKESIAEVKKEIKAKLLYWNNLKSSKAKVALIIVTFGVIVLKIFTLLFSVDWLNDLFSRYL